MASEQQSLLEKAASLKQILENSSPAAGPKMETLESQIRDAAHKAEDIIESIWSIKFFRGLKAAASQFPLQQVMQELDSAMERVVNIMDGDQISSSTSLSDALSLPDLSSKNNVVGLGEDLIELKDRLPGQESELEMRGKTTLARNFYNDPLVVSHFDTRAWITISQDYNV